MLIKCEAKLIPRRCVCFKISYFHITEKSLLPGEAERREVFADRPFVLERFVYVLVNMNILSTDI